MKVKRIIFSVLIGGGFIALLLFLFLHTNIVIQFDGENYNFKTEKYLKFFKVDNNLIQTDQSVDLYGDGELEKIALVNGQVIISEK